MAHVQGCLLVEGVAGPAARAGVMPGDILLTINGVPVKSIDQMLGLLEKKPKNAALLIQRNGDRLFVPVELS
jgi:serine protease Do